MKLGEALSLRARQAQKLNDLRKRATDNALTQEGESPAENAGALLQEYREVSYDHAELLARIGRTNARIETEEGTLADTLHARENLRRIRGTLEHAANAAVPGRQPRYMRSELKYVAKLDVPQLRREIEGLDAEIREYDARIQEINWRENLAE